MSEKQEFELLKDIARLLAKYGPDTFDDLSKLLGKSEFTEQLLRILSTTAEVGRKTRSLPNKKRDGVPAVSGIDQLLRKLAEFEPEKSQLLSTFLSDLRTKNVLYSMRDLKAFVSDNGLAALSATSRAKAIFPLIKDLSRHPVDEVKVIIERAQLRSQEGDRTLEGWANIILKKPHSVDQK